MFARRGLFRTLVLLCAALQLALPGVAALADGLASRTSVHATAHIESGTERDCVRVHETDCVFCQFLSTSASPAACATPAFESGSRASRPVSRPSAVALAAPRLPGNPRAPPLS